MAGAVKVGGLTLPEAAKLIDTMNLRHASGPALTGWPLSSLSSMSDPGRCLPANDGNPMSADPRMAAIHCGVPCAYQ
jgi:hypothetical protein